MGATDGAVLAFRKLVDNGANNLRYNIVLVSEGYTEAELPLFRTHCRGFLRALFWTAPFDTLRCTFNVFALEVRSTDSGTDDPATCADGSTGSGAAPATFFDSSTCGGGRVRRIIGVDAGAVMNKVKGFLPEVNSVLVLVNSPLFGGVGGNVAIFTTNPGWEETALHEFGHLMGLADEYGCYVCDGTDSGRTYDWFDSLIHGYGFPNEANVSDTSARTLKWASRVASTTPMPTTAGSVPAGTVGAFESAKYYDIGLFRPEEDCRMRTLGTPFCAVCRAEIIRYLSPWTPTTTCVTPTANPPTLTLNARVGRKVMISPGRGGYEATLNVTTTNLPGTPTLTWRLDGGMWTSLPMPPNVQVPINKTAAYIYAHTADVTGLASVADLDYWVPGNPMFTTAVGSVPIALLEPNDAANTLGTDYDNAGNVEGNGVVSINVGGIRAGNGWLYLGRRKYYTRIAVRVRLHEGYFGPDDNANWAPQNITWTPAPSQSAGLTAFYDVTFDANGLCWLTNAPSTVVDPNVGFRVTAKGKDAIGQAFNAAGTLRPTNVDYTRSISTIQVARIPTWEWPMQFILRDAVVNVIFEGTQVAVQGTTVQIGDVTVEVEVARPG